MKHNQVVQREFSKQASRFGEKGLTLSSEEILGWIIDSLPLNKSFQTLDVASGTGILSRAVSPHVGQVVGIDITRSMLSRAHEETKKHKIENTSLVEGSAETLPFQTDYFDLVVSRLAIHHFENPAVPLQEMVRVCRPNGKISIIDLLSPDESGVAETYNHLERLRDPSHTVALSGTAMGKLLLDAGIHLEKIEARNVVVDFLRWVQMTGTTPETVAVIRGELMKDIGDGSKTGMRPFIENGSLKFIQLWSVFVGTKN